MNKSETKVCRHTGNPHAHRNPRRWCEIKQGSASYLPLRQKITHLLTSSPVAVTTSLLDSVRWFCCRFSFFFMYFPFHIVCFKVWCTLLCARERVCVYLSTRLFIKRIIKVHGTAKYVILFHFLMLYLSVLTRNFVFTTWIKIFTQLWATGLITGNYKKDTCIFSDIKHQVNRRISYIWFL